MMKRLATFLLLVTAVTSSLTAFAVDGLSTSTRALTVDSLDIAPVWAGHPVGFALVTRAPFQFAAFYDDQRSSRWRNAVWTSVNGLSTDCR